MTRRVDACRTRPRHIQGWLLVLMLSALATPARAAARSTLTWSAPTQCPDEQAVRARARALIAHEVDASMIAHVHVSKVDGVFRANLRLSSPNGSGQRTLVDADCGKLAEAVALVFALAAPQSAQDERWQWTLALY